MFPQANLREEITLKTISELFSVVINDRIMCSMWLVNTIYNVAVTEQQNLIWS